ncbi:guanine nucleotide-binding protein subunit alpha [Gaertneriomyces sp. JEL0708]|nr:guanine nucleotide-binding protein subunit alpha [Gaertneriomyces sp. JEL0708]
MGGCCSFTGSSVDPEFYPDSSTAKLAKERNAAIEKSLSLERRMIREAGDTVKLLLLGPSEAGKSTVLKQIQMIYGKMTPQERMSYRHTIVTNITTGLHCVRENMTRLNLQFANAEVEEAWRTFQRYAFRMQDLFEAKATESLNAGDPLICARRPSRRSSEQAASICTTASTTIVGTSPTGSAPCDANIRDPRRILQILASAVQTLHADPAVQRCLYGGVAINLMESASYFVAEARRIFDQNYEPTDQDILNARAETQTVIETRAQVNRVPYIIYDVAGARSKRHQWAAYFDDATAIIFVVAISEYDKTLKEDPSINRVRDAIELFQEIAGHHAFRKTSIILFLNKIDLFKKNIESRPVKQYFPEFDGDNDFTSTTGFFAKLFVQAWEKGDNREKQLYTHLTHATDQAACKIAITACTHTIARMQMRGHGIL